MEFAKPYPMKSWGIDSIAKYIDEHNIDIKVDDYSETEKEKLCLDIKDYISAKIKEAGKVSKEGSEINIEKIVKPSHQKLTEITPKVTTKIHLGTNVYSLVANVKIRVPRDVAVILSNAGLLKYYV